MMKHTALMTAVIMIGLCFSACHKENFHYEKDFDKSYNTFLRFKNTTGNSYTYTVAGGSWTGYGWQTTLKVVSGIVVERYFKMTPPPGVPTQIPATELEWTEPSAQVGIHALGAAAEAVTLDEIYNRAKTDWLIKRSAVKTYFEAKNNGMISDCGYVPDNCQDDCFRGITITQIRAL